MKLSALKNRVARLEIKVGDGPEDKVVVNYKPGALTYDMAERIQLLAAGENPDKSVVFTMLMPLVESWDLQDDEGNDLGVTEEVLGELPLDFVANILVEIKEQMIAGPLSRGTSPDGSSLEEGLDNVRTITPSSEQRGSLV